MRHCSGWSTHAPLDPDILLGPTPPISPHIFCRPASLPIHWIRKRIPEIERPEADTKCEGGAGGGENRSHV